MEIGDIIRTHMEVLSELNTLLDYEKEVLIKDDAKELYGILDKKKLITQKIAFIEKKRQEMYGEKTAQELADDGLISKGKVDELIKLTEDIKEKNETNLILTRQSIYYIKMITQAITPNQRVVTYGNNGSLEDGKSKNVFSTTV